VFARIVGGAVAFVVAGGLAAQAQNLPWPSAQPQQPGPSNAPWPTSAPSQAPGQAPGQAPMTMGPGPGPGGPPGLGGPSLTPEQQDCLRQFTGYRSEVEKRAMAAQAEAKKKPTREKMCELVTAYSAAETKWIKFSDTNMKRCGIPAQAIEQIKGVHTHTLEAKKKLCAPGPAQAGPVAPSLSDALGGNLQPTTDETKKPKRGGTMDTLTGPISGR
jgi:hypothetical protein